MRREPQNQKLLIVSHHSVLHQTLKYYLHNCQWDINNFEDTDLGLEGV